MDLLRKSLQKVNCKVVATNNITDALQVYNCMLLEEATITVCEVVPWFTIVLDKLKIQLRCLERTAKNLRNMEFWKEYKQVRSCYFKCVS